MTRLTYRAAWIVGGILTIALIWLTVENLRPGVSFAGQTGYVHTPPYKVFVGPDRDKH